MRFNPNPLKNIKSWVWSVLVLVVIISLPMLWYRTELQPPKVHKTSIFRVDQGQNVATIGHNLKQAGIIRDPFAFEVYAALHGLLRKMQTGVYVLTSSSSASTIAETIAQGKISVKRVTIPEGDTVAQIRKLVTTQGIPAADFDKALTAPYPYTFLQNRSTNSLEGYLFPDSYTVTPDTTAQELVSTMLDTFQTKVTSYQPAFAAEGLTLDQGLTLASMIEKEVANSTDRPIVAQVFLKRLKEGQALQSDVTVNYAANLLGVPFSTTLDSPYNTYANTGLPLGPICNPGLSAINAAAHPANTDYSYFLAGKDGKTHFATTFAEHEQNIAAYGK